MELVKCLLHDLEFRLPTSEDDFISGRFHDEVERCQSHIEGSSDCKFVNISN